jgi:hypothetical protein
MSSKFLDGGESSSDLTELTNGTFPINAESLTAQNLIPSSTLKTDANRKIVSAKIDSEDLNSQSTIDFTEQASVNTPLAGDVRVYSKTDKLLYIKDDTGTETVLGGGASTIQETYDESATTDPQLLTSATNGALKIQSGQTLNTDTVLEVKNKAGTTTFQVDGNGDIHLTDGNVIASYHSTSSGVVEGGVISFGTPNTVSTFSITAGEGIITDTSTGEAKNINWGAFNNISRATDPNNPAPYSGILTWISINTNGIVIYDSTEPTASQSRDIIQLGILVHITSPANPTGQFITTVNNEQNTVAFPTNQLKDLFQALGFINISGNLLSSNSLLTIAKADGYMLAHGANYANDEKDPHTLNLPAIDTNIGGGGVNTFQYRMRDGSSGPIDDVNLVVDKLDDGTPYPGSTIGTNKWGVNRVYSFTSNALKIMPTQTAYNSEALAIESIGDGTFIGEPSIEANGLLIGYIIVQEGTTVLTGNATFLSAGKFGTSTNQTLGGTQNLQSTYDNSPSQPQITVNDTNNGLIIKSDQTLDTDSVLQVKNLAGAVVFDITADSNVRIGELAGSSLTLAQGDKSIAIGSQAGKISQEARSIAIGSEAAEFNQGLDCVAIGRAAGFTQQRDNTIAIGQSAGENNQLTNSIAVGKYAGQIGQNIDAIALGTESGQYYQGDYSVSIGYKAGEGIQTLVNDGLPDNSIALGTSAFNSALEKSLNGNNPRTDAGVWIGTACIKNNRETQTLHYNTSTGEITESENIIDVSTGEVGSENYIISNDSLSGSNLDATSKNNILIGQETGINLVSGTSNILIGRGAGNQTTGNGSVAIGHNSAKNMLGGVNTTIGISSMLGNPNGTSSTGDGNSAFGQRALQIIESGNGNCAFGKDSLKVNTIGDANCAYGVSSLSNCVGNGNLGMGTSALLNTTTGSNNVGVGLLAGATIQTGIYNTLIGGESNVAVESVDYSIGIGGFTVVDSSNQCKIGGPSLNQSITEIVAGRTDECNLGSSALKFKNLFISGAITDNNHGVNKLYVDNGTSLEDVKTKTQNISAGLTSLNNTVFNGALFDSGAAPVSNLQLTNKLYVDTEIAAAGGGGGGSSSALHTFSGNALGTLNHYLKSWYLAPNGATVATYDILVQSIVLKAGTITELGFIKTVGNFGGILIRVNNITQWTPAIPVANTGTISGSVSVSAGDIISVRQLSASAPNFGNMRISLLVEHT